MQLYAPVTIAPSLAEFAWTTLRFTGELTTHRNIEMEAANYIDMAVFEWEEDNNGLVPLPVILIARKILIDRAEKEMERLQQDERDAFGRLIHTDRYVRA